MKDVIDQNAFSLSAMTMPDAHALSCDSASRARATSIYQRLCRIDQLLHEIMEDCGPLGKLAAEAHHEVHEASYEFVTSFISIGNCAVIKVADGAPSETGEAGE